MTAGDPGTVATWRDRIESRGAHPIGVVLLAVAATCLLASFTVLNWFREGPGFFGGAGSHSSYSDIGGLLDQVVALARHLGVEQDLSFGLSETFFSWLGWVLAVAAIGVGTVAVSYLGRFWPVRWFAGVVGVAGAVGSATALQLFSFGGKVPKSIRPPSFSEFVRQSGSGAWAAVLGFLLVAIASLLPGRPEPAQRSGNE